MKKYNLNTKGTPKNRAFINAIPVPLIQYVAIVLWKSIWIELLIGKQTLWKIQFEFNKNYEVLIHVEIILQTSLVIIILIKVFKIITNKEINIVRSKYKITRIFYE